MEIKELLQGVKDGRVSVAEAERTLANLPYEDLGYARLDHHRAMRCGFPETVFCQGKADKFLVEIYRRLLEKNEAVLGTRATEHQYRLVRETIPDVEYDPISRILKVERSHRPKKGCVAVCSAGTADVPVAEEAAQTAEFFGCHVERIYDVGVAGLHRLLAQRERIRRANCVIAVAGMEGALATVIGGLVEHPVIAVPTSVGYGASFQGLSALLTMLNSCANGVGVVNIDNGYGAAYLAAQINGLAAGEVQNSGVAADAAQHNGFVTDGTRNGGLAVDGTRLGEAVEDAAKQEE